MLLTSIKFCRWALASSDAFPQKGLAWIMLTSPVFISKPSMPWSLFSPVGIWLLDGAENWWSVFWAMGIEAGVVKPWSYKVSSGRTTMRQTIDPIFLDLSWSDMVDQVWSCTALQKSQISESNGNPAKISGDKLINFIKLFENIFSQLLPRQCRQKCLLVFLMLNRIWIPQAHRITVVALHLGVFQSIVIFLKEVLW